MIKIFFQMIFENVYETIRTFLSLFAIVMTYLALLALIFMVIGAIGG
jgi:hypothetical protein